MRHQAPQRPLLGCDSANAARIVHVTDCYLPRTGGIETQVRALAERQHLRGHDVKVVTLTAPGAEKAVPSTAEQVIRFGHDTARRGSISYSSFPAGPRWIQHHGADVVHIHASSFSPLAFATARAAARLGIPTVVTVHSLWNRSTPLFAIADQLTGWAAWPVAWSAVSQRAAVALRRILPDQTPVTVLANGVEPVEWSPAHPSADRRRLRIVTVGRLARRKRLRPLTRMLQRAQQALGSACRLEVTIIGEGPARPRIERFLHRSGMQHTVALTGAMAQGDVAAALAGSDLYVAPARLESFGIAALEARCAGLPVLAMAHTGIEEFITHGVDGWLVDGDDDMTAKIVELASNRSELLSVAHHNRTYPPAITWSTVLDTCDQLYYQAGAPSFAHPSQSSLPPAPGIAAMADSDVAPGHTPELGRHLPVAAESR
ncbi:MAG: glycosyltransferase family 4 protein [Acidobacteriota bacterium]|nr:glycosyltransferase family 4 protein [Acidobacteriota bacterium]